MSAVEGLKREQLERGGPARARVEIQLSGQPPRRVALHGPSMRLGRDPGLELNVDHPAVSKQHARLEAVGSHWLIRDSGSTNGLFWRGQRVRELLLRDGDVLRFGPPDQPALPELVFQRQPRPRGPRLARGLTLALAGLASGGALLLGVAFLWLPVRGSLAPVRGPLALYDRLNRPVSAAESSEHRENDALSDFPPALVEALLASEDSRFWWHPGVDPIGTARALATNVLGGRVLEGGSTLTQQLARSLYPEQVGQGETLIRKWRELLVALQLEARFSKGELLLSYLNRVYLGVGWGFEDAARHYFAKPAAQLSLEEAALLVGLLPSPNGHDPCLNPQAALEARNVVLLKMADSGRLSPDQARRSRRSPIQLGSQACRSGDRRPLPYYTDQVRLDLERLLGADVAAEGNFLVETHLDPPVQAVVERELRRRLAASAALGVSEGAVVLLDSRSGGVIAIAGGRDYSTSQYNRASQAQRQPGSTFKLFTYLAALQRGARPGDPISCSPLSWRGQAFSSGCGGNLSLRQAFAVSSNTAALRLARRVGLEAVVQQARDLGISSSLSPVPGLTLGQSEVRLIELTAAYAAVANGGVWHAPSTIRRLTDAETCSGLESERCRQLRHKGDQPNRAIQAGRSVLKPELARRMQGLLQAAVRSGTGRAAYLGGQEGGKTGTTNGGRDLLFIGSEPSRHWVMGIWLGNDDNSPTRSNSALAAGLWGDIMRQATPSRGESSSGPPAAKP
ncbi:transglycosylase domain-containing protein [Synechococcus sp. CS-1329]|uniref:transglycosylase domain-containing protein n=1 Tax=Synechococcus sp. CS-1329 TaxID=2847975 RepID=UPI00223C4E14|nr:transglycosylase domain-containing protein [Synechococcus sp. CS-1329]MCT0219164.1 transglycosylase domain-containing protein [Synechococcus sp. CS-1329]